MPQVTRRPLAETDILEIWDYIADDGLAAADRWVDQLDEQFRVLATQPVMGRARTAPTCSRGKNTESEAGVTGKVESTKTQHPRGFPGGMRVCPWPPNPRQEKSEEVQIVLKDQDFHKAIAPACSGFVC